MQDNKRSGKSTKSSPRNPEEDLKDFIKKKKTQNKALKKIIDRLNTDQKEQA